MRSQPDRDGSTDGRDDLDDGRVKAVAAATTSSIPSSVISGSRSGTGTDPHHHRSRPSLFQGTRSSSDDKLSDNLLHSPVLPSRIQSQLVDTDQPIPVEAAVWDWQAPTFGAPTQPETSDQSSTYFYEPQGELLLHQAPGTVSVRADEFNIPGPVVSPTSNRSEQPALNPLEALLANTRVPDDNSVRIGAKRKSAPDVYEAVAKRPTLDMVEFDRSGHRADAQSGKTSPVVDRRNLPASAAPSAAPLVLPARKVFPIQIGDKLFRLSGASISSDGMSMSILIIAVICEIQLLTAKQQHRHTSPSSSKSNSGNAHHPTTTRHMMPAACELSTSTATRLHSATSRSICKVTTSSHATQHIS